MRQGINEVTATRIWPSRRRPPTAASGGGYGQQQRPDRGARLDGREERGYVHEGVRAAQVRSRSCCRGRPGRSRAQAFEGVVGKADANGVMVPGGWNGGYDNALSDNMVEEYIANYGGTAADVSERGRGRGVLHGRGGRRRGRARPQHEQREDNGVPAQRGHTPDRAGAGEVRRARGRTTDAVAFVFQWQDGNFVQVLGGSEFRADQYPEAAGVRAKRSASGASGGSRAGWSCPGSALMEPFRLRL